TFLCFIPISSISKYSLLSCIRLITQQISFELVFTIVFSIILYPLLDFILTSFSMFNSCLVLDYLIRLFNIITYYISFLIITLFHSHYLIIIISFIFILGDCNRVPFDLIEAESELIAGFIIDYSSIYFSIILLTEYGNIIIFLLLFIILLLIIVHLFYYYVIIVCLIRASLNRIKFNELMITA
ncbi:MAG: NADH-quinone oxidoreductase subunit H, partial [Gammaproteobacteria bacterium]|nr:NADH-quinone oxidoreductase subunit H [Gammaproteobacteria bacterium]